MAGPSGGITTLEPPGFSSCPARRAGPAGVHELAPPGLCEPSVFGVVGEVHVLREADRDRPRAHVLHESSEQDRAVAGNQGTAGVGHDRGISIDSPSER